MEVLFDELGLGDLSSHGSQAIRTPTSTASQPTDIWQDMLLRIGDRNRQLPTDEISLSEVLRAAGYNTKLVGKWHLGDMQPSLPAARGFESFFGLLFSNDRDTRWSGATERSSHTTHRPEHLDPSVQRGDARLSRSTRLGGVLPFLVPYLSSRSAVPFIASGLAESPVRQQPRAWFLFSKWDRANRERPFSTLGFANGRPGDTDAMKTPRATVYCTVTPWIGDGGRTSPRDRSSSIWRSTPRRPTTSPSSTRRLCNVWRPSSTSGARRGWPTRQIGSASNRPGRHG